ncbi:MAG: hypothetical protein O3B47_00895 [bacterium]|nr:hypothetical protein [bacterium]
MKKILLLLLMLLSFDTAWALGDDEMMGKVIMDSEFLDGDILKISVIAQDMLTPVLGLAFHLDFDEENLSFLRYDPGDFLERGGDPFYLVTKDLSGDKLFFGETLRRDDGFPVGEGIITDFYFQILDKRAFYFSFENGVISTLDTVRQDIDKIVWEDLYLDENGEMIDQAVFDESNSLADSVRLKSSKFNVSQNVMLVVSVCLSLGISLAIVVMMKTRGKKRHDTSVNF